MKEISELFTDAVLTTEKPRTIKAFFKDGRAVVYTMETLALLKTDPDIATVIDDVTGEILY